MRRHQTNDHVGVDGPVRTCIGCRRRGLQSELSRIGSVGGQMVQDRVAPGRGAWLCAGSASCLALAVKKKGFDKAFRRRVAPQEITQLIAVFGLTRSDVSH